MNTGRYPETDPMAVAVWDTYVPLLTGEVLHFDIVVPQEMSNESFVYDCGTRYLLQLGCTAQLTSSLCRFCHVEQAPKQWVEEIRTNGFAIVPLETIPATLPTHPSRREMILYLRGHVDQFRFADFRLVSDDQLRQWTATASKSVKNS